LLQLEVLPDFAAAAAIEAPPTARMDRTFISPLSSCRWKEVVIALSSTSFAC
jgi:hypothetical protein